MKNYDTENEKVSDRAKERTNEAYCFWLTHRWNSNATVPNWRLIAHKLNMMIFAAMMSSSSLSAFDEWWRLFILHLSCDFALCVFFWVGAFFWMSRQQQQQSMLLFHQIECTFHKRMNSDVTKEQKLYRFKSNMYVG